MESISLARAPISILSVKPVMAPDSSYRALPLQKDHQSTPSQRQVPEFKFAQVVHHPKLLGKHVGRLSLGCQEGGISAEERAEMDRISAKCCSGQKFEDISSPCHY